LEDGFRFLTNVETTASHGDVRLDARLGASTAEAWVSVDNPHSWWRATSLGAPGSGAARFHFVRVRGRTGSIITVWDLNRAVSSVSRADGRVSVVLRAGARHAHSSDATTWRVSIATEASTSRIDLSGAVNRPATAPFVRTVAMPTRSIPRIDPREPSVGPLEFQLGETQYRRSEQTWEEAGSPAATVSIALEQDDLVIVVDVRKRDLSFAAATTENPLDNEHPDINSDGIQLHMVLPPTSADTQTKRVVDWLMVPELSDRRVRVNVRASGGGAPTLHASWARTTTGYRVRAAFPIAGLALPAGASFLLGVIVNEISSDRERRRGQLVLGGGPGDFIYLRGDRQPAEHLLGFTIDNA
jgi:hypothetical protein